MTDAQTEQRSDARGRDASAHKKESIKCVLAEYAMRRYLQFKEKYEDHGNSEQ